MSRAIVARAPTRLDFGGGWTDVSPYADEQGGAVCNVAITRYATATVSRASDESDGDAAARSETQPPGTTPADDALVRAALAHADLPGATAGVSNDFPIGAGLGGSSAAGVALAGALAALGGTPLDRMALADRSRRTEVEQLGVAGGFQDHYAAAFGGALLLTFDGRIHVQRLALSDAIVSALPRRVVLVYTGESRVSGSTITAVADACRDGNRRVHDALTRMKELAHQMAAALRGGDLDTLGSLLGEHWTHQRALHPTITTPRIDAIEVAARRAGALGMKALGASGGGCVMAVADHGREDELVQALAPLGQRLTFAVDPAGFDVVAVLESEAGRPDGPEELA